MRIFDPLIAQDIEIAINKKQQKELTLLKSHKPRIDGYSIFEYDKQQKTLSKASFIETTEYHIDGTNNLKLHVKPGCAYVEALNEKNAIKRLKRGDIIHS